MADGGRYRRIFVRLWRNEDFVAMDNGQKVVALYLLTGPQTNRIGFYRLSMGAAADDLGTIPETFAKRCETVCQTFNWQHDLRSQMLLIPTWWEYNKPANPKMIFKRCVFCFVPQNINT